MADNRTTLKWMELFSRNNSFIHKINPVSLFMVTMIYIVTIISFEIDDFTGIVPLILYPAIVIVLSEIPVKLFFKIIIPIIPLALFFGIAHPFYDKVLIEIMPGVKIARGWITGSTLVLRFVLTVTGAILFMAVTGIGGMIHTFQVLRVPKIFITIFAFSYRYIHTLQDEAAEIITAYKLRSSNNRGVDIRDWGSMGGQWFIRSYRKADRIHKAMLCRGQTDIIYTTKKQYKSGIIWFIIWTVYFTLTRLYNIPHILNLMVK